MNENFFHHIFEESVRCKSDFVSAYATCLCQIADVMLCQLKKGNKIILFGNGGSAADAQHLAAEFVNRLMVKRPAIAAISLATDTSVITSIANDDSFDQIFARQIEAFGQTGDIAWGMSTSGNSANIVEAFRVAKQKGLVCVASLGNNGGNVKHMVDYPLVVHSSSAQRIQEVHITLGHALCEWVETSLCDNRTAS